MTAGIGSTTLGSFSLGSALAGPDESQPLLVESRKVDHVLRKYVFDSNGEHVPMSATASRIALLVAFQVKKQKFISPIANATTAANIRAALLPLTSSRPPDALIKDVRVTNFAPASTRYEVVFVDLAAGGVAAEPDTLTVEVSA